tara:strand:- start:1316 stop:1522 length:207 start_codon:yes stop_codon:yes gene_type:complete
MMRKLAPLHPGKMIEENLKAIELSVPKAAVILSVSKQHLYRVVQGKNPIRQIWRIVLANSLAMVLNSG